MDNTKTDRYYIEKILENGFQIEKGMIDKSKDDIENDNILQAAMMFFLIQISENAKHISEEMREKYPYIPWTAIYGLRNRVVHDYGNVDMTIVYDTLTADIPYLIEQLENI